MRPQILFPLFTDIASLKGIGSKFEKLIIKLCGPKTVDILWHLPYSLIDRTYIPTIAQAQEGKIASLSVRVVEHFPQKTKKQPYRVLVEDDSGQMIINFFKVYGDSIAKNLPVGATRFISGKIESFNEMKQMTHPDYIVRPEDAQKIIGIEPVYPLTAGVSNKMLGKLAREALARVPDFPEWLEPNFQKAHNFPSFRSALLQAHFPKSLADIEPNSLHKKRLAYDELLANQLALALVRQKVRKQVGRSLKGDGHLRQKVLADLPFSLTNAQKRVLDEISADMESSYKMLRLLQGDVGSGKTIVALLTMLNAVECGAQAAIMAPTEILAKQHLETIKPLCDKLEVRAELLTGRVKGKSRKLILEDLADGKIDILIGTHALFVDDVAFKDLACIVVDEQHRFGVQQRLALSNKGNNADILVMTATPIPRTLVLTAYGDMEYSKIDEVPAGRKPVDTRVLPLSKLQDVVAGLKRKLDSGCRAYWVCPLVEESEKTDLAAAEERFQSLQKLFGNKVGMVHGRMKETEKDAIMEKFKSGEISLLVATTVIEVGVNVPEATLMIIEQAERFGLAQLHQLRGRIKRGFQASNCLLLYGYPLSDTSRSRLDIMRKTEDGFEIAEKDLELRGGGELLGNRQSGFSEFKIADMSLHKDLLYTANKDAKMIVETDCSLATPRGQALRILLYLFEQDDAVRTYLAG